MTLHTTIDEFKPNLRKIQWGSWLDRIERTIGVVALGWIFTRLFDGLPEDPANTMLLVSEAMPVLMLLIRRGGKIADSRYAWIIGIIGTFMPIMLVPRGFCLVSESIIGAAMLLGLMINIAAKICLNRSFGIVAANRGIKHSGPYRLVRHPMYLGYSLTLVGYLLRNFCVTNALVCGITWTAFALRIRAEEGFLMQDAAYRDYSEIVRYRMIPGII